MKQRAPRTEKEKAVGDAPAALPIVLPANPTARIRLPDLRKFIDGLLSAFRDIDVGRDAQMMRSRYSLALAHLAAFTNAIGLDRAIGSDLIRLAIALHELEQGTVHPVLKPVAAANRPIKSSDVWHVRALVVASYEFLRAGGLNQPAALAHIRGEEKALAGVLSGGRDGPASLHTSLFEWRKALKKGQVASWLARRTYEEVDEMVAAAKDPAILATAPEGKGREDLSVMFQDAGRRALQSAVIAASKLISQDAPGD
jgi:hypothetical protein